MQLPFSTHYYVLSLNERKSALFEAFRDSSLEVENQGFPVLGASPPFDASQAAYRLDLAREVDRLFGHYYACEPLKVVTMGTPAMLLAFRTVTRHGSALIGQIEIDPGAAAMDDVGPMAWPVVKEAMSGVLDSAMRDLHDLAQQGRVVSGLEAVARAAHAQRRPTLLVEDDYHVRGSLVEAVQPVAITSAVDVRATIDDVIDLVIERVLEADGDVVFAPPGSLGDWDRIALLLRDARSREPIPTPEMKSPS